MNDTNPPPTPAEIAALRREIAALRRGYRATIRAEIAALRAEIAAEIKTITTPATPSPSDDLLTVPEAAEFLQVKQQTIYVYLNRGTIRGNNTGRRVYITRAELIRYMKGLPHTETG